LAKELFRREAPSKMRAMPQISMLRNVNITFSYQISKEHFHYELKSFSDSLECKLNAKFMAL